MPVILNECYGLVSSTTNNLSANEVSLHCHVSCVPLLRCRILPLGCCMASRKETTIERIYREVTGNKMPAAVKRVLLPKRKVKRH
jgi:hypothetical protein